MVFKEFNEEEFYKNQKINSGKSPNESNNNSKQTKRNKRAS